MTGTTRRGKAERENILDINLGVGRTKFKMSEIGKKNSNNRSKSLYNGKLLSLGKRVAKLRHMYNRMFVHTGKALYEEAMSLHSNAIATGQNLLGVLCQLAYPDAKNEHSDRCMKQYEAGVAEFARQEKLAVDSRARAEDYYSRNPR